MNNHKTLVPTFIIHANGSRISVDKEACILEIIVIKKINDSSDFIIKISDIAKQWNIDKDFSEGTEISITLGYKDNIKQLITGTITSIIMEFRDNSSDILIIKGKDALHSLKSGKRTRSYVNKSDSDIIKEISKEMGLKCNVDQLQEIHKFTIQTNLTDFDYISAICMKYNCKMWIKDKELFVKFFTNNISSNISDENFIAEWGKTLKEFYPILSSENLITEMEVRGWDENNNKEITGNASANKINFKIGGEYLGIKEVEKAFGKMKAAYIDENISDKKTADKIAENLLIQNSMKFITASGKIEGNTKIEPGMIININEVGDKFSGEYFVNTVKHILSPTLGYETFFDLSRNAY